MAVDGRVLRRALDTLDDVFYIYDEAGGLVYWNQRLNELYGLSDAELDGMVATAFFESADRPAVEAAVEEIVETGETVVEAWGQTTEGRIRFELTGRRLTDDDGETVGFAGIGRDVTERHEQAGQLSQHNERLAEFADLLAHDIRNPLSVASGHLALARDGDEASFEAVEAAHDRIDRIIDDIRLATREGTLATDIEPTDVVQVAGEAWEYVDTVGARFEGPETLRLDADADRLLRLFENLFRNSVEHGSTSSRPAADDAVEHGRPRDGGTVSRDDENSPREFSNHAPSPASRARQDSVEHGSTSNRTASDDAIEHGRSAEDTPVTVRLVATATGFAVEDDGPGVDEAIRDRVFDPGVSDTTSGTGFGLYIVRTIAAAHGWTVAVTDAAGGGARFEFTV